MLIFVITTTILLIGLDWRISILALAVQYVGVFIMTTIHWPLTMAATKLVAGWIAGAVLGMAIAGTPASQANKSAAPEEGNPELGRFPARLNPDRGAPGLIFKLFAGILVGLTALSLAPALVSWAPQVEIQVAWGSLLLVGIGLLQLGLNAQPLRIILGLLTILAGFEVLYAVLETAALVAGLLAGVTLAIALIGAYLITAPQMEETG